MVYQIILTELPPAPGAQCLGPHFFEVLRDTLLAEAVGAFYNQYWLVKKIQAKAASQFVLQILSKINSLRGGSHG